MSFIGGIPTSDVTIAQTSRIDSLEVEAYGIKKLEYIFTATVRTTNFTIPTEKFNPLEDEFEIRYMGITIEKVEYTLTTNTITLGFELQVGEKIVCSIFKKVK